MMDLKALTLLLLDEDKMFLKNGNISPKTLLKVFRQKVINFTLMRNIFTLFL